MSANDDEMNWRLIIRDIKLNIDDEKEYECTGFAE